MASVPLYSAEGERTGEVELGGAVFGHAVRADLIHQAVETELWNRRQGTRKVLSRSEVRGGGRKPYRQKGTGRARQGSIRSPQYRHGGVVHGPTPVDYVKKLPQKMRRAALRSALSARAGDGAVRVCEELVIEEISTRRFVEWLGKLEPSGKSVLVLAERNQNAALSARNIPNLKVIVLPGLSTYEVMKADTLIFTRDAVAKIEELYTG